MRVKIYGAGSIGNHLAQAARRKGWQVVVIDQSIVALDRMRDQIYPSRYGKWDPAIQLYDSVGDPRGGFDLICIGTPPDVRLKLAIQVLAEKPRVLLLEKPLCAPSDSMLQQFLDVRKNSATQIVVGYDHAVAESIQYVVGLLKENRVGDVLTIDVEFREHWEGIFKAHPWLSGPADSYLGHWDRGGGASGEHSHALHLWFYLAKTAGLGRVCSFCPCLMTEGDDEIRYDSLASFSLTTENGRVGRVVQDVVTKPPKKFARIQGSDGFIEWTCAGSSQTLNGDLVVHATSNGARTEKVFKKTRPDDFYAEMNHIGSILNGGLSASDSPISLSSGLEVMALLSRAWERHTSGRMNNLTDIPAPIRMKF